MCIRDSYYTGEKVRLDIRNAYRKNNDIMFAYDDPFAYSNMFYNLRLGVYLSLIHI